MRANQTRATGTFRTILRVRVFTVTFHPQTLRSVDLTVDVPVRTLNGSNAGYVGCCHGNPS